MRAMHQYLSLRRALAARSGCCSAATASGAAIIGVIETRAEVEKNKKIRPNLYKARAEIWEKNARDVSRNPVKLGHGVVGLRSKSPGRGQKRPIADTSIGKRNRNLSASRQTPPPKLRSNTWLGGVFSLPRSGYIS